MTETGLAQDVEEEVIEEEIVEEEPIEEVPEEVPEEETVPQEAKEFIKPSMKKKTQKRIVDLVKKNTEKEKMIEDLQKKVDQLMRSDNQRTMKENNASFESQVKDLQERRKAAYEEGDFDKINSLDMEFIDLNQKKAQGNINSQVDPESYFSERNSWYRNEAQDPGNKKTFYAQSLSNQIFNDPSYSHLTDSQKLDEVSRQTNEAFKTNQYRNSAPTDGVTTVQEPKSDVAITESFLNEVKMLYPNLKRPELIKVAKEFKKNMKSKGEFR